MAVGASFQIVNLVQFNKHMQQIAIKEQNWIKKQIKISALNVQRKAKRLVPKDSGLLSSRIKYDIQQGGFSAKMYAMTDYAVYVHWGTGIYAENGKGRKTPWFYRDRKTGQGRWTRGQKPKLFLKIPWDNEKPDFLRRLRRIPI